MNIREGLSFDDVLLVPKRGVLNKRKEADISSEIVPGYKIGVPIISANMPSVTNGVMAQKMRDCGAFSILHRFGTFSEILHEFLQTDRSVGCSIGLKNEHYVKSLYDSGCRIFCLDVAHGDHEQVQTWLWNFGQKYDISKLIVGNVATYDAAETLCLFGVGAIKVGIGPGAACITREITGFGVPQLTAIMEVKQAIKDNGNYVKLIADGGIKNSGDIIKALAAGADTVMIGSLLAGCDEAPNPGFYYGNASKLINGHNAPEGVHGNVPKTGSVSEVIKKLAWGIRSGISYGGATNIKELQENAEWIKVSPLSVLESGARI